ncbi:unnamed protein product, partial [Effrenium voratum]
EKEEKDEEKKEDEADPNLTKEEQAAHIKPRSCTDVICIFLFVAALVGLYFVVRYGWDNGDTRRIYHGINWEGEVCGLDSAVKDKPLLYWCTKPGRALLGEDVLDGAGKWMDLANQILPPSQNIDLLHPVCVSACPANSDTFHSCLQEVKVEKQEPKSFDGSFWMNSTYISRLVQDVAAFAFARRFCLPQENFILEPPGKARSDGKNINATFQGSANQVMYGLAEVIESRWAFIIAGAFAAARMSEASELGANFRPGQFNATHTVVLSYIYMFLVDLLAAPVIYVLLFLAVAGPIATGLYFIYGAFHEEVGKLIVDIAGHEVSLPQVPTTSDRNWDIVVAVVAILAGIGMAIFWCCKRKSINFVVVAIKATIRVLYDVPTLVLLPAINTAVRGIVLILALWGFALILSAGEIEAYDVSSLGYVPHGIARTFSPDQDGMLYLIYYVFCAAWIFELVLALQQFVVAYTVQVWYNSPVKDGKKRVPCCPITRAFFMGLTYHLGSLAFGAVLLALLRVVYLVVAFMQSQAKQTGDEKTNAAAKMATACCCCCLDCARQVLKYLNSGAFVMVAVNSDGYCTGADRALRYMASEFVAIGALEGSTFFFQVLGNIVIPGSGGYFTYLVIKHVEHFNDPSSDGYIAQPGLMAAVGSVVCLGVSISFMAIFDTVSDAMLFAFMTDEDWRNLQKLLDTTKGLSSWFFVVHWLALPDFLGPTRWLWEAPARSASEDSLGADGMDVVNADVVEQEENVANALRLRETRLARLLSEMILTDERFLRAVKEISKFISHSWHASPLLKTLTLHRSYNLTAATVLGNLGALVGALLFSLGLLPGFARAPRFATEAPVVAGLWASGLGCLFFVLALLLRAPREPVFLDRLCINQENDEAKAEGVINLGACLKHSKTFMVIWDATYCQRFELAAFLKTHEDESVIIEPISLTVFCLGSFFFNVLMWCGIAVLSFDHPFTAPIMILALCAYGFLLADLLVRYSQSLDSLKSQLQSFRFAEAKISCCSDDHKTPEGADLMCDRSVLQKCVEAAARFLQGEMTLGWSNLVLGLAGIFLVAPTLSCLVVLAMRTSGSHPTLRKLVASGIYALGALSLQASGQLFLSHLGVFAGSLAYCGALLLPSLTAIRLSNRFF